MDLPEAERNTLLEMLESFKNSLVSRATGGDVDQDVYRQQRKTLLGYPPLAKRLPRFVTTCRTPDEFWNFIQPKFSRYAERRQYLAEELNPLIEALEVSDTTLEEHFKLGEVVGKGGFGVVYRVHHALLDMDFAIKVFAPSFQDEDPVHLDRFFREARILFALNHPNIVRIFDVGLLEGRPYIRMEFFPGQDVNSVLSEFGNFPSRKAAVLAKGMAEALAHAHAQGVVHRDLKPSNVLVAPREKVKVVDFGLGVFVEGELLSRITRSGQGVGAGSCTAPELAANPKLVDPRSDIYSVGAVWYSVLVGQPPIGLGIEELLDRSTKLSHEYKAVLLRCLRPMESRYQSADALLEDMDAALQQ